MSGETALRRQARGEKRERGEAERAIGDERTGRRPGDQCDRRKIEAKRERAHRPPGGEPRIGAIEARLQRLEPASHPGDRMADRAIERRRIADQRLDDGGGERERQREREGHGGGVGLDGGARSLHLSRRRARSRPPPRPGRAPALDRSFDRRQSARLPPAPSRAARHGRDCPTAARSQGSKPPPPSATARARQAWSQAPARRL